MTKEQGKTIKLLKNFTKMDFSNPMGWTGYYDTELKELSQAVETVLKEIEKYQKLLADNLAKDLNNNIKAKNKANKDLEDLNEGWKLELEKKDKQIDLMAEHIQNGCDFDNRIKTKKEIKQYFASKVEKE